MKFVKKLLLWTVVAFFLYAVFRYPDQAANIVQGAWDLIVSAAQSIGDFFNNLLTRN
jgi:hypothetical protein